MDKEIYIVERINLMQINNDIILISDVDEIPNMI